MIVLAICNDDMSKGNTASQIHFARQYLYFCNYRRQLCTHVKDSHAIAGTARRVRLAINNELSV